MRATLTIERTIPAPVVERVRSDIAAHLGVAADDKEVEKRFISALYDDGEASAWMRNGAGKAMAELDAAARKLGMTNSAGDIQYGFNGVRSWSAWYLRTYS